MKKYISSINGSDKKFETELSVDGKATVNGKVYDCDHKFITDNVIDLRINNYNYFLTVSENDEVNTYEINLDSTIYKVVCKSELDILIEGMSKNSGNSKVKKEIRSPMPGIIKSLNIKDGQQVKKGDVLLVLEAMKMENEIKAQLDGVIKKVNVNAMSSVEKNEMLFEYH